MIATVIITITTYHSYYHNYHVLVQWNYYFWDYFLLSHGMLIMTINSIFCLRPGDKTFAGIIRSVTSIIESGAVLTFDLLGISSNMLFSIFKATICASTHFLCCLKLFDYSSFWVFPCTFTNFQIFFLRHLQYFR